MVNLASLPDSLWTDWTIAVRQRRHPLHTAVVATLSPEGPQARTVVLRSAEPEQSCLSFHTDVRSPKVDQLRTDGRVLWLFYDPTKKVQIRVRAVAELHQDDEIARKAWQRTSILGRRCYAAEFPPGQFLDTPPPAPNPQNPEAGWENFMVVRTKVQEIDWLHLAIHGHQRALLRLENHHWCATWAAP